MSRARSATAIASEAAARAEASRAAETGAPDPGLAKEPRDLELPPWNKGRYGTAVGRAVHAVLQTVDLATGEGIVETAAAQAAAEGVLGLEDVIVELARSALASDVVRDAVANGYRREMYVAAPISDADTRGVRRPAMLPDRVRRSRLRTESGLVVVDYKTDGWATEADLDAKLARYRLQGASYALALAEATGEPVARCVFLFLAPAGAVARDVDDLPRAVDEVRELMREPSAVG